MNKNKFKVLIPYPEQHLQEVFAKFSKEIDICVVAPEILNLREELKKYDAYVASLALVVDEDMIKNAKQLKIIATPSTGTDHLPKEALKNHNVQLITLRDYPDFLANLSSTAEHAWALLLALVRQIPAALADVKNGNWSRNAFIGHQLRGMRLGILGYGRLGSIVAKYANAFNMEVIYYDKDSSKHSNIARFVTEEELFTTSDVISIHIHLDKENIGYVSRDKIFSMKRGSIIINTSRGAIVDESALIEALDQKLLSGVASDVIAGEWQSNMAGHPMIKYASTHNNLILTPHCGGTTIEAQQEALRFTIERLIDSLKRR